MHSFDSIWSLYGMRGTPFSTAPLRLFGNLQIEGLFANRLSELQEVGQRITSSISSRTLIMGEPGVGKTSFANFLRWQLCIKGSVFLTPPAELKIQESWDHKEFLRSTLVAILNGNTVFDWASKGVRLTSLDEIRHYIVGAKMIHTEIGVQIIGSGGSLGYGESLYLPPDVPTEVLEDFFLRICKDFRDAGKSLILQYNNLENVCFERASKLFLSIREYLQIDGLHTLFLGPVETLSAIEAYPQVRSVFPKALFLAPLNEDMVLEVLKKRCELMRISQSNVIFPYDEQTIRTLHKAMDGNIRSIFKVLEDSITLSTKNYGAPHHITFEEILLYSQEQSQQMLEGLTHNERKIVFALSQEDSLTPSQLAQRTLLLSPNLSAELRTLKRKGLIVEQQNTHDKRSKDIHLAQDLRLRYALLRTK